MPFQVARELTDILLSVFRRSRPPTPLFRLPTVCAAHVARLRGIASVAPAAKCLIPNHPDWNDSGDNLIFCCRGVRAAPIVRFAPSRAQPLLKTDACRRPARFDLPCFFAALPGKAPRQISIILHFAHLPSPSRLFQRFYFITPFRDA